MAKIPIRFEKIKDNRNSTEYIITLDEKGQNWKKTFRCQIRDLERLQKEISELIENTSTAEKLGIDPKKGKILDQQYKKDALCKDCSFKLLSKCLTCIFECQSPLERKLFLALEKNYIRFNTQYALNWNGENISIKGKTYSNPKNNFKEVLTVADFHIKTKEVELCIYTDGHTYHERTEEQAQRDKRIDRKLQQLGYQVLRYTGKDINENLDKVIKEIKSWT